MSSLSIGRAWDEGKAALRANQKWIVPVALGLILLPAVIVSMVEPQVPTGQQPPPGSWMLVAAAMALVMIVGQLAIVLMVNGWRGSVGEAIGKSLRRTPTFVIAFLCVMVPVILIISFLLAIIGIGTSASGQVDWATFSGVGWLLLLLCMVLVLYLSIRLLPLIAVVASENDGPVASLKRSWSLTSGHFWRLLGFLLMLMIGFLIVALAVGALIGTLVTLTLGPTEPWSLSLLLISLAGGLVQAAFVMVYIAMIARIYAQLSAGRASVPDVKRAD